MKLAGTTRAQRELMSWLQDATTAVGALGAWVGDPGSVVYDRYWQSATYTPTTQELRLLQVTPRMDEKAFKRLGFLRRGVGGRALAFVQMVALPQYLPKWVMFELLNSDRTIGDMIVRQMNGTRSTLSVDPVQKFDREGNPLSIKVQALLSAVPPGHDDPRPLVLVTEWIYEDVTEMRL